LGDLVPCYRDLADVADAGLGPVGEMTVAWRVQPDGSVQDVRFVRATPTVSLPSFEGCLEGAIMRWHFRAREVATDAPAVAVYFGSPPPLEASPGMYIWRTANTIHTK
jgi:hypothetical protein